MIPPRIVRLRQANIDTLHLEVLAELDRQEAEGWRPIQEVFGRDKFGPFAEIEFRKG